MFSRAVSGVALLLLAVLGPAPLVQAQTSPYTPQNIGLQLGMSELDLVNTLTERGFAFKAGGEHEPIAVSQEHFAPLHDFTLYIDESAGSVDIWSSGTVVLGVKNSKLVSIGEINRLNSAEANSAFEFLEDEFDEMFASGPEVGQRVDDIKTARVKRSDRKIHTALENLQYFGVETPDSEQAGWLHDNTVTFLSTRLEEQPRGYYYNQQLSSRLQKKGEEKDNVIVLVTIDACMFPEFVKHYQIKPEDCE